MNNAVLIGNLTRDPEVTLTAASTSVCRFTIAVNRNYVNADGERETDFINIVAWRGLADNCGKHLRKGSKVAVSGSIQIRSYEGKDGSRRTATEILANNVEFLTPRGEAGSTESKHNELEPIDADDLPF